jgi:hypothetical protein
VYGFVDRVLGINFDRHEGIKVYKECNKRYVTATLVSNGLSTALPSHLGFDREPGSNVRNWRIRLIVSCFVSWPINVVIPSQLAYCLTNATFLLARRLANLSLFELNWILISGSNSSSIPSSALTGTSNSCIGISLHFAISSSVVLEPLMLISLSSPPLGLRSIPVYLKDLVIILPL